ncbi:CaiB/BaiF CoA transferase family protein [Chloroflexota bacterium]
METPQALDGLKVLDFTWVVSGPTATKCLGEYGATIIKVESNNRLGLYRSYAPYAGGVPGMNRGYAFAWYNSNKYGITLNLNHPRGVEVCKQLIAWADVVVENFTAETMERWNLGYEELRKVNRQIIMIRASIQGQKGPYTKQPGFGTMMQAAGGYTHLIGWPDRAPIQPSVPVPDFVAAWYIVILTMAALDHRSRTGEGTYIDLSQLEAGITALTPAILEYSANQRNMGPIGNHSPRTTPHGVFRCRGDDRWCAISISQDSEWESFCRIINRPWAREEKFATLMGRKQNEDELERLVEEWTMGFSSEEVMSMLQKNSVPAGVVQNSWDLANDPQLGYRKHFRNVKHTEMESYVNADFSFRLSKTPGRITPAPCLGEHNHYIYKEILGMSDEEFVSLMEDGVFD